MSCDPPQYLLISNQIEEYWREHVSTTLRDKSGVVAVNTFFLFNKLFMVSATFDVLSFMPSCCR